MRPPAWNWSKLEHTAFAVRVAAAPSRHRGDEPSGEPGSCQAPRFAFQAPIGRWEGMLSDSNPGLDELVLLRWDPLRLLRRDSQAFQIGWVALHSRASGDGVGDACDGDAGGVADDGAGPVCFPFPGSVPGSRLADSPGCPAPMACLAALPEMGSPPRRAPRSRFSTLVFAFQSSGSLTTRPYWFNPPATGSGSPTIPEICPEC